MTSYHLAYSAKFIKKLTYQLPSEVMKLLGEQEVVITVVPLGDPEESFTTYPCLFSFSNWEIIEAKVMEMCTFHSKSRRVQRYVLGYAMELEMDSDQFTVPEIFEAWIRPNRDLIMTLGKQGFWLFDDEKPLIDLYNQAVTTK